MSKPATNVAYGLNEESVERTREVFQPYKSEPLSREDCREIHRNLIGAFQVLLRIKKRVLATEPARAIAAAGAPPINPEVRHE